MEGINPQALHHSYIISGDRDQIVEKLFSLVEKELNIQTKSNPDFFYKEYNSFYIDDTRDIRTLQQNKTLSTLQLFVLSMREMTHQAQNAFLKITEDPSPNTCFFFVLPNHEVLLPTLLSRAVIIKYRGEEQEYVDLAGKFLATTPKGRFDIILPFHPKDKEDVNKEKIGKFLSALEVALKERGDVGALHDVYDVKQKIRATGVSVKTLLEHLSMIIPFQK